MTKSDKYELIADDTDAHKQALDMIEHHIREYGEMPAATREESLELALDAVNERAMKEAEKWRARLTKVKKLDIGESVETPEQPSRAVSEVANSRTLTNSMTTGPSRPASSQKPRSDEDYRAAAMAILKQAPR